MQVPNEFPTQLSRHKVAFVGDFPTETDHHYGKPFIGPAGRFLTVLLMQAQQERKECFLGNVCQFFPEGNNPANIPYTSPQVQEGLQQLKEDLQTFAPNIVVLMGAYALKAAGIEASVAKYRGTVFICENISSPFYGYKCIATHHPSAVFRSQGAMSYVVKADIEKAFQEARVETLDRPERKFELKLSAEEIIQRLQQIEDAQKPISFDIEGTVTGVTCCGIATSPFESFIVPFFYGKQTFFSADEEARIWAALSRMLANPRVPKILQNSLYDSFVLAWTSNILIRNVQDDTMLKHWELFPELEKSLGFQTSFYTKEPYYKNERLSETAEEHHRYCCKDAMVTYEISLEQDKLFSQYPPSSLGHYRNFNIPLLPVLLYMELRGIKYDSKKAQDKTTRLKDLITQLQAKVDTAAGGPLNTSSSKQMLAFLSKHNYPITLNRKTGKPTANYEAILKLAKKTNDPVLLDILMLKSNRTRVQMLNIRSDNDGRIRCGYNLVGTDTGRLTCYTSPTGSGYNLQTIPEYDRDLFLADDGYHFFQCDLSGADAWTVAAWSAKLGDPTMLDDLKYGIKAAKVIAAMFKHGPHIAQLDRETLKGYCDQIPKNDALYFGSKCVQHGSNYGAGVTTVSATIFIQSEGTVNLSAADCRKLQDMYFIRYPGIKRWHNYVQTRLSVNGTFLSASGHRRIFSGDRNSHEIFKRALANEPQENTTYATNLAAKRLWHDPENRWEAIRSPKHPLHGLDYDISIQPKAPQWQAHLIIQPLHQVHDALAGQFPIAFAPWAVEKIRSYFANTLTIADQQIHIPYEGGYGPSWGELDQGEI